MSKYDRLVSAKENALRVEAGEAKEQQQKAFEATKTNRLKAETALQEIVLPELRELQESLQKEGRTASLILNEPLIESHKRKVLVGVKLLVAQPNILPGVYLEFGIAEAEQKILVNMLVGSRPERMEHKYQIGDITPVEVQRIIEQFIEGLYL